MYSCLVPKQQFRYAKRLLDRRQLAAFSLSLSCENAAGKPTAKDSAVYFKRATQNLLETARLANIRNNTSYVNSAQTSDTVSPSSKQQVLEEVDADMPNFSVKTMLYEEADEMLKFLNACRDFKELMATVTNHSAQFQLQHNVQSIVLLYSFFLQMKKKYITEMLTTTEVELLLSNLRSHVLNMNPNELSCCYLYLRKMGVPNTHPVLQEILAQALHTIETNTDLVGLPALSRLAIGINIGREFFTPLVCRHFMLHILPHIEACATAEQARLLSICMLNVQPLIDIESLELFKARVKHLLQAGIINAMTPKVIFKVLHLLNHPAWSVHNLHLLRELLLTLSSNMLQLQDLELKSICYTFQHHLEPAGLMEPLKCATKARLKAQPSLNTLVSYLPFAEPMQRGQLISLCQRLLKDKECWEQPNAPSDFFMVLRALKMSSVKDCNTYWENVVQILTGLTADEPQMRFLRYCNRYMHFNNNLGGTYRNRVLERTLSQMAMKVIQEDVNARIPSTFARLAAFVIAYGHTPHSWYKVPNEIVSKIVTMADQFSIADCFLISRGLQIALEMRFRKDVSSTLKLQFATIANILSACADRHLIRSKTLTSSELNSIVRSLAVTKSLRNSVTHHTALGKYNEIHYQHLSSRTIRDMAYNLNYCNFRSPRALEAMFDYVKTNSEHTMGETVEKVLSCAYNLGYTPESLDVFEYAAAVLLRDFKYMSGISLVQACLALCFYKAIPEELINRIFCATFIKRIEEEIQMCYSKATYPERVLNLVMQLNRTVCLDFPEANIPWFQQNFIEAQLSKTPFMRGRFKEDVKALLTKLMKDETYYRCNHVTPYGYQIDFMIHFDQDKKPIQAPVETAMLDRITKVAILLLKLDSYCANDLTALRGPESLKIKHLEMMGYKVLHINEHDWNSKYLKAPAAKANYLKCLLQITS